MQFHFPVRLHGAGEDDLATDHTVASEDNPVAGNAATSRNHPDTADNTITHPNDSGSDNNTATQCAHLYHGRSLKT